MHYAVLLIKSKLCWSSHLHIKNIISEVWWVLLSSALAWPVMCFTGKSRKWIYLSQCERFQDNILNHAIVVSCLIFLDYFCVYQVSVKTRLMCLIWKKCEHQSRIFDFTAERIHIHTYIALKIDLSLWLWEGHLLLLKLLNPSVCWAIITYYLLLSKHI